jgi:hypothetical protein
VSQSKVEAEAIRSSVSNGVAGSRAAGFAGENIETLITDQSALFAGPEDDLRVDALVAEGDRVAQGQPVLRSRRHPELVEVAPVAGTIASVDIAPGRRLSSIVFFYESDAGRHVHAEAALSNDPASVRQALQGGGLWSLLRSRPFGRVPKPAEKPAAIFVMAADSRPHAPSPALAIEGREEELSRGLAALALLTDGPIYLCHDSHVPPIGPVCENGCDKKRSSAWPCRLPDRNANARDARGTGLGRPRRGRCLHRILSRFRTRAGNATGHGFWSSIARGEACSLPTGSGFASALLRHPEAGSASVAGRLRP